MISSFIAELSKDHCLGIGVDQSGSQKRERMTLEIIFQCPMGHGPILGGLDCVAVPGGNCEKLTVTLKGMLTE